MKEQVVLEIATETESPLYKSECDSAFEPHRTEPNLYKIEIVFYHTALHRTALHYSKDDNQIIRLNL